MKTEKPIATNISRKAFFNTNINDANGEIEFYPSIGIIALWALLITIGIIITFFILAKGDLLWVVVILVLLIYGFKTLSKTEPILLIRFFRGDYFLKKGIFGKKVLHGNLSELQNIEMDAEFNMGDQGGIWVEYWIPILKWKNGKQFVLGKFSDKYDAVTVSRELCNRLKISYIDESPSEKYL